MSEEIKKNFEFPALPWECMPEFSGLVEVEDAFRAWDKHFRNVHNFLKAEYEHQQRKHEQGGINDVNS